MLLEEIKPPVFKTSKKIKDLVKKYGMPSQEVLSALRKGKKKCGPEYDVVKKAKV